jgi:hypothetical protein
MLAPGIQDDRDAAVLSARAEKKAEPATSAGRGGNLLFSMNAADNAACIRSITDVNGDGKDEVVVGIDESGVDNLFCLDGASSGTATVVWSLMTSDGVSGGGFYGDQCLNPSSDVDGNGKPNFLAGTAWGGRTAYNFDGLGGSTVWKLDTYTLANSGWIYSLCECGDVNNDGVPEAVFGAGSYCDTLFLIDGASTGGNPTVLWEYFGGDAFYTVDCIGDADGDGKDDVIGAIGDNVDKIVCLSGTDKTVIWTYDPGISVYSCGVLPDINSDGINEAIAVLWTMGGSAIRLLNGATGVEIWASTDVPDYGMMVDILEDVTGDGSHEIIVSSWDNSVIVLDGSEGYLIWQTEVGTVNGGDVWTARAIEDLNGDGRQDVIAGSFDYHVYAMDGDSGEVFWSYNTGNRVFSVYPVGDLNGDGWPEVAAGTQDTSSTKVVYVLEGDAEIAYPGLTLIGSGGLGTDLEAEVTGDPGWQVILMFSLSTGSTYFPSYGWFELGAPFYAFPTLTIPPGGPFLAGTTIPNDPGIVGITLYFQALAGSGGNHASLTDMESVTFF